MHRPDEAQRRCGPVSQEHLWKTDGLESEGRLRGQEGSSVVDAAAVQGLGKMSRGGKWAPKGGFVLGARPASRGTKTKKLCFNFFGFTVKHVGFSFFVWTRYPTTLEVAGLITDCQGSAPGACSVGN